MPATVLLQRRTKPVPPETLEKNMKILRRFIEIYCQHHHSPLDDAVCAECQDLIDYAQQRISKCPYDPKPKCKECPTHCYKPAYRQKVKEVMRYSGMYFVKRGRIDWLVRYFLMN